MPRTGASRPPFRGRPRPWMPGGSGRTRPACCRGAQRVWVGPRVGALLSIEEGGTYLGGWGVPRANSGSPAAAGTFVSPPAPAPHQAAPVRRGREAGHQNQSKPRGYAPRSLAGGHGVASLRRSTMHPGLRLRRIRGRPGGSRADRAAGLPPPPLPTPHHLSSSLPPRRGLPAVPAKLKAAHPIDRRHH